MATNAEVAEKLGLSHSTVSRMRTGKRLGSTEVLQKISAEYDVPLDAVITAAVEARAGRPQKWTELMDNVLADA